MGFSMGFFQDDVCLEGASVPPAACQLREVKVVEIPIIFHRVGWHHPFGGWEWDFLNHQ